MKTKRGVELDLKESDFIYNYSGFSFVFSSKFYLKKFSENIEHYILEENAKIKNKYSLNFNFDLFFAISFYKKIEKRGFRVLKQGTEKEIKENSLFICNIY